QHIVVETSGVADPGPIALTLQRPELRRLLRLDAIVAVAEAEQFWLDRFDGGAARSQLRLADAILLNKCDRADASRIAETETRIARLNPGARVLRTVRCVVPLPLVLDGDLFDERRLAVLLEPPGAGEPHDFASFSFAD